MEKNEDKFINIGCSANNNFARHIGAMMFSLLENCSCPEKIRFFLIDDKLSEDNKEKINKISEKFRAKIEYLKHNYKLTEGMKESRHISIESYYRFSLIENQKIKKLLYLDGDIIVKGDVKELFEKKFEGNTLFAVKDPGGSEKQKRILGIPKNKFYFSCGVLLIDCEKWRKNNFTKKITDYIKNNPEKIEFADQDGSNAVLYNEWEELDPRWNVITRLFLHYKYFNILPINGYDKENIRQIIKNPKIIHYAGFLKPWYFLDPIPKKQIYWQYLHQTPWKNYRYKNIKIRNILNRALTYQKMLFKEIKGR